MAFLHDNVLDNGLAHLSSNGNAVYICSQEPANYTEATSTYALGNKTGITIGSPADYNSGAGRGVTVPAITDGSVTATGTATHYAVVDTVNTVLLATAALASSLAVTSGQQFSLTSFQVAIPYPA